MSYDLGKAQVAVWLTEEAIEAKRQRLATETDPLMVGLARRSLASLESLLAIQQRSLDLLVRRAGGMEAERLPSQRACGGGRVGRSQPLVSSTF